MLLALIVVGYFGASTLFLQRRVLRPIQRFADNLAALNESAGPIDLGSSEILELEQANDRFQRLIAQIRKLKICLLYTSSSSFCASLVEAGRMILSLKPSGMYLGPK